MIKPKTQGLNADMVVVDEMAIIDKEPDPEKATKEIEAELEFWMGKQRNSYTEKKVKKLIAKAGFPKTAASIGKRKAGGRP